MHTRGYGDVALVYGEPLAVGKSTYIATVRTGCHVALDAAVFVDGRSFGNPSDLEFIWARRQAAAKELRTILQELYDENPSHAFEPTELANKVAKHKSAIDPNYRNYPRREEEAKAEAALEEQIGFYRKLQAERPEEETGSRIEAPQVS